MSWVVCEKQAIRNGLLIGPAIMLYIIMTSSEEGSDVTFSYSLFVLIRSHLINSTSIE
jgi:hypothetical protein